MTEPTQKKGLKLIVKKDGFQLHTDSSKNDIEMMGLLVILVLSVVGIVTMYKLKKDK